MIDEHVCGVCREAKEGRWGPLMGRGPWSRSELFVCWDCVKPNESVAQAEKRRRAEEDGN